MAESSINRVLMFEPNHHHYEVIPGFAYYLNELGYKIDCLVQDHTLDGDEFCLMPRLKEKINIIQYKTEEFPEILDEITKKNKYEFVFCTSIDYLHNGEIVSLYKDILKYDHSQWGLIACCHAVESYRICARDGIEKDRIVFISSTIEDGYHFHMVNPNQLSENLIYHKKNECARFVSVGVSNDNNESRKALNTVYESRGLIGEIAYIGGKGGAQLQKSQLKKRLLFPLITLFNIKKYNNEGYAPFPRINSFVKHHIRVLGRVPFEKMFEEILSSDFILLNIAERFYKEFSTEKTSGSKQLSLGLCKPCIIERKLAEYYGFSDKNAILYEKNELHKAIAKAIEMTDAEYITLQNEMKKLQQSVCKQSTDSFKDIIENIKVYK